MPRYNDTPTSEIPEVQAYDQAREMLDAFRQQHANVFDSHSTLVEDVRQKMQAADQAVRTKGVSCGVWEHYQNQKKYDAQALYEALGREEFMRAGGIMQTVTQFDVDKNKLEAAAANGEVPKEVIERVRSITKKYHAPKPTDL